MSSVTYEPKRLYGKLTGQIINRDEQCKAIHGPSFYACPQRLVSKTRGKLRKLEAEFPFKKLGEYEFLGI